MIYLYCTAAIVTGAFMMFSMANVIGGAFGGAIIGHAMVLAALQAEKDRARR